MAAISKLIAALAAVALVLSLASTVSATQRKPIHAEPSPSAPTRPPAQNPRQFLPTQSVQPLTPEIEQSLQPKDSFKECDVCPEMVVVPKGSFLMGTPATEPYRLKGEDPQHSVTLSRRIAVGRHHHFR